MAKLPGAARQTTNTASLYFHYPCFDGLVSAALAWEFLESCHGWRIGNLIPVDYKLRRRWLARKLKKPAAVVDFLYHSQADFWADHHETSLAGETARSSYERRKHEDWLIFDMHAASCASLLYRRLRKPFKYKPHFAELVRWAEKIDSATYSSLEEAILGDTPALRINRTLMLERKDGPDYARFLLAELREHNLDYVANLKEVRQREKQARQRLQRGLDQVRARASMKEGDIVVVDTPKSRKHLIHRYAPYHAEPEARYSIGIVRSPDNIAITAMRNPWKDFKSIAIGRALEEFGGGGHRRVGAVRLSSKERKKARDVVQSLLTKMRGPVR